MDKAHIVAEELRAHLYDQLVGHYQSVAFSVQVHDRFIGDELVKEASRLCGMFQSGADKIELKKQLDNVRTKTIVAETVGLLGEQNADEAYDMITSIKEHLAGSSAP